MVTYSRPVSRSGREVKNEESTRAQRRNLEAGQWKKLSFYLFDCLDAEFHQGAIFGFGYVPSSKTLQ